MAYSVMSSNSTSRPDFWPTILARSSPVTRVGPSLLSQSFLSARSAFGKFTCDDEKLPPMSIVESIGAFPHKNGPGDLSDILHSSISGAMLNDGSRCAHPKGDGSELVVLSDRER
jgi:hypothetical protein